MEMSEALNSLLEAECRSNNTSGYLAIATAHLQYFNSPAMAERCYRKAVEKATDSDDQQRIQDFLSEFASGRIEISKNTED